MKKIVALMLLFGFAAFSAYAATAPAEQQEKGFISVSAETSDEVESDQAIITFAVEATGKDMQKATEEINELSTKLSEIVKIKLLEGDSVKTTSHTVVPIYYQKDKKRVLSGYKATNKMVVTTKNLEQLPSMISLAMTNGATEVSGLSFSLTDYNKKCNELIGVASKRAHDDAVVIAKSVGSNLNGIKMINAHCGTQTQRHVAGVMMKATANGESADAAVETKSKNSVPAIEPGTIKINAYVDASFYVK